MYRFLVVIEKAEANYSAYAPDLPGCVATGSTREEAEQNMHQAIEMHIRGLLKDNLPIPKPLSFRRIHSRSLKPFKVPRPTPRCRHRPTLALPGLIIKKLKICGGVGV